MSTVIVRAPNPSVYTGAGTNTYLVGKGAGLFCIDPGPDIDEHLSAIVDEAARRRGRIAEILVTHSHDDHRPLAHRLSAATGAPVRCFDPSRADDGAVTVSDGERVVLDGLTLEAVHTPGHSSDHVCFFALETREMFTGDHILTGTTSVIEPTDGNMVAYLQSLRRLQTLGAFSLYPGHGEPVSDGAALVAGYIEHRLQREEQILDAARGRGAVTPRGLAEELYTGYPEEVLPIAAMTVESHLRKLVDEGRAERASSGLECAFIVA